MDAWGRLLANVDGMLVGFEVRVWSEAMMPEDRVTIKNEC